MGTEVYFWTTSELPSSPIELAVMVSFGITFTGGVGDSWSVQEVSVMQWLPEKSDLCVDRLSGQDGPSRQVGAVPCAGGQMEKHKWK